MLQDNLIILRDLHGYSQEQVAEKVGVSRQAYAKWEKGETQPDIERCQRLAELYETTIDQLVNFSSRETGIEGPVAPAPRGKHIFGTVTVSERGQIVIPKEAREVFGITGGTKLLLLGDEEEGLALMDVRRFEERMELTLIAAGLKKGR